MYAKKSLGQNFLMHPATAERIADAADLPEGATVLEIGPGTGMLTQALLARAQKVVAVEADHELIPALEERFSIEIQEGRLVLIEADIRNFNPSALPESYHLVANIPYYITGELIRQFLTSERQPSSITILVQKEVAERIARSKQESLLSLSVKVYGTPRYCFTVPRGAFIPAPNVDSAVLHIQDITREVFSSPSEEAMFFAIIRAGFGHKRKRLRKNLEEYWPKDLVAQSCSTLNLDNNARAEELSLSTWIALTQLLRAGTK